MAKTKENDQEVKVTSLKPSEIRAIEYVQKRTGQIKEELGDLDLRRMRLEIMFKDLLETEANLLNTLEKTYGRGSLDLTNHVFIPDPNQ